MKIEMIKLFINQNFQKLENIYNADIAKDLQLMKVIIQFVKIKVVYQIN